MTSPSSLEIKASCHVQGKLLRAQRAFWNLRHYSAAIIMLTDDQRSAQTTGEFLNVIAEDNYGSNVVHRSGSILVYECFERHDAIKADPQISSSG